MNVKKTHLGILEVSKTKSNSVDSDLINRLFAKSRDGKIVFAIIQEGEYKKYIPLKKTKDWFLFRESFANYRNAENYFTEIFDSEISKIREISYKIFSSRGGKNFLAVSETLCRELFNGVSASLLIDLDNTKGCNLSIITEMLQNRESGEYEKTCIEIAPNFADYNFENFFNSLINRNFNKIQLEDVKLFSSDLSVPAIANFDVSIFDSAPKEITKENFPALWELKTNRFEGREEEFDFLTAYIYSIFTENSSRMALVLESRGGDGKSELISAINSIFDYSEFGTTRPEQSTSIFHQRFGSLDEFLQNQYRFSIGGCGFKRFVSFDEAGDTKLFAKNQFLKSWLSHDSIQLEEKFVNPVSVKPVQKVIIATNQKLQIDTSLFGESSRVVFINFDRTKNEIAKVWENEKDFSDELKQEMPNLLKIGRINFEKFIQKNGEFNLPESLKENKFDHNLEKSKVYDDLIQECIEVTNDKNDRITESELFRLVEDFAHQTRGQNFTIQITALNKILDGMGIKRGRYLPGEGGNRRRADVWNGIKFCGVVKKPENISSFESVQKDIKIKNLESEIERLQNLLKTAGIDTDNENLALLDSLCDNKQEAI